MGNYGISLWLPSVIKNTGVADAETVGLLSAIPWAAALIAMIFVGFSADRQREYRWHVATSAFLGAVGLATAASNFSGTVTALASLSLAAAGITSALPVFWNLPAATLSGVAAAGGIALINSVGNLAGFLSPYLVGWLGERTGSPAIGLAALAGFLAMGSLLTLLVRPHD